MADYQTLRHYESCNVLRSPTKPLDGKRILKSADCIGRSEEIVKTETNYPSRSAELWIQNGGGQLEQ
jgi:hypothetical protein